MLTITNNQQTPNFRAQVKMKNSSAKIGQYLKNKGINPNAVLLTSAGAAGVAGTVAMFSPDMVSAPDAAKYGIFGGMASTIGSMGFSAFKKSKNTESVPEQETTDKTETVQTGTVEAGKAKTEVQTKSEDNLLFEVNDTTPIGSIKLSKNGKDFYLECINNYFLGKSKMKCSGKNDGHANSLITGALLQMEVLQSLHELSTRYNEVISSKTFGEIKVTDKGIKDYLEIIEEYTSGNSHIMNYGKGNDLSQLGNQYHTESLLKMEILKSLRELSTQYNNVISSETFGTIKVTKKGLEDYLEAIKEYSSGIGYIKAYGQNNEKGNKMIISAKEKINIIKTFGELKKI